MVSAAGLYPDGSGFKSLRVQALRQGRKTEARVKGLREHVRKVEMAQTDVTSAMGDLWAYRLVLQTKGDSWWVVSVMYPINQPHDLVRI